MQTSLTMNQTPACFGAKTFCIMTLSITKLSINTFSFIIKGATIFKVNVVLSVNVFYDGCFNSECRYAVILSVILRSVIMLSIFILNVVVPRILAPCFNTSLLNWVE
jgi:hypothetical protein